MMKRREKFYQIDCPVTVEIRDRLNGSGMEEGRLREIGIRNARCYFARPMAVKARVGLRVYFRQPTGKRTIVMFDAVVAHAAQRPPYATTLRFLSGARFVRDKLGDLLEGSTTSRPASN